MRIIDADALVNSLQIGMSALEKTQANYDDERNALIGLALSYIGATVNAVAGMPTIDAVPVVRCKDCVHRDPEDKRCDCGGHEWFVGKIVPVADDFYCADGERKDGERDERTD